MVRSKINRGGRPPTVKRRYRAVGARGWRTGYLSDALTEAIEGKRHVLIRATTAHESHVIAAQAHTQARRAGRRLLCTWSNPNLHIQVVA